jgi:hypothetical protein
MPKAILQRIASGMSLGLLDTGGLRAYVSTYQRSRRRGLKTEEISATDDLFDAQDSPRDRSMVITAVQWPKRIMAKIDEECGR